MTTASSGRAVLRRQWVALGLVGLGLLGAASAATPSPAAPLVTNTMAQRVLACTACHGPQGRASAEGYVPRIAGKPAGYLYQQLLAFRDGRRRHDGMARLLEHLGNDYLAEVAAHFASLEVPYPPPPKPGPQATAQALARGKTLALVGDTSRQLPACTACHGAALTGVAPEVPGLLGLPQGYLLSQLGGWRVGARQARAPDCMAQIAQRLSAEDVAAVAEWLQLQPVPVPARAAALAPAAWPMACGGLGP